MLLRLRCAVGWGGADGWIGWTDVVKGRSCSMFDHLLPHTLVIGVC